MKYLLPLILLSLLFPLTTGARPTSKSTPPSCTAATLTAGTCVVAKQGTRALVTLSTAGACLTTGSITQICEYDGSNWVPTGYIGTNGDSIINSPDGTFNFTRDEGGTVILTVSDDSGSGDTSLSLLPSGTSTLFLGGANTTSIRNLTDGVNLEIDTLNTNTVSITNSVSGSVLLDLRDYADTTDDDMAHGLIEVNCTTTTTGAEDCDMTINTTEAGTAETRITMDGDGDIDLTGGDVKLLIEETATFGAPNKMTATPSGLNQYVGIPRLNVTHIAALTDGPDSVAVANPLLANCSAVVNGTETDDTSFFITGSSSYKYVWPGTVAADDGIDCVIAYPAATDPTRLGFWFRSDTAITSGDIDINFDDGGVTDGTISTFATTVVNEWQWVELDITTACSGECASVDGIEFLATAQAASGTDLDGVEMYIDQLAMWAAADEVAIGDIQVGGLIDFASALLASGGSNLLTEGVEWTSYFITYQSGADAIISITDLQLHYATTLEALND